jgi:hypothetical protein
MRRVVLEATPTVDGVPRSHLYPRPSASATELQRPRPLRLAPRPLSVTVHRQGHSNGSPRKGRRPRKATPRNSRGVLPLLPHRHPETWRPPETTDRPAQDPSGMVCGLALRSPLDALLHSEQTKRLTDRRRPGRQPLFTVTPRTPSGFAPAVSAQGSFRNTGPAERCSVRGDSLGSSEDGLRSGTDRATRTGLHRGVVQSQPQARRRPLSHGRNDRHQRRRTGTH